MSSATGRASPTMPAAWTRHLFSRPFIMSARSNYSANGVTGGSTFEGRAPSIPSLAPRNPAGRVPIPFFQYRYPSCKTIHSLRKTPVIDEQSDLKIERLSHRYSSSWAIRDINIEISRAGITGLLGSNGAGKSTTMNILCGVLNQTEGQVFIDGINMRKDPEAAKKLLGFLPQTPPLYMDLTVDEYLTFCALLRLMEKRKVKAALGEAKERCGITHFGKRLIKNLSGGYRQRVGIAQAIIHRPRLVVLDEPTNGLDPNQIVEVRALIKEIAADRTVIFSSHILSEVQILCNDITMIDEGKIVFADTMDAFNNYVEPHSVLVQMNNPPAA